MVKPDQIKRSSCPVSCALDILGDKWTLLVIRDILFMQKRYFQDFLESPEKIASNILSDRLKKLEECNIVSRQRDPGTRAGSFIPSPIKGWTCRPPFWSYYAGAPSMIRKATRVSA